MFVYPPYEIQQGIGPAGGILDVRVDHGGDTRTRNLTAEELLALVLEQMLVMNAHLGEMRGDEITVEDVT